MLHAKFQDNRTSGSAEEDFKSFSAHLSRQAHKVSLKYTFILVVVVVVRPSSTIFKGLLPRNRLAKSKPNFMWSLHRKGERKFVSIYTMVQVI